VYSKVLRKTARYKIPRFERRTPTLAKYDGSASNHDKTLSTSRKNPVFG
jgi:hypothetical protein